MRVAVVDASVTAAWLMRDEQSKQASELLDLYETDQIGLVAPALWQFEVTSAEGAAGKRSAYRELVSATGRQTCLRKGTAL